MQRRSWPPRRPKTRPPLTAPSAEEAVAKGVFGSPTYLYEGQLFWGQDRLDFLESALAEG